jgi:hypothetical protein
MKKKVSGLILLVNKIHIETHPLVSLSFDKGQTSALGLALMTRPESQDRNPR